VQLSKKQSIIAIAVLFTAVVAVIALGFLLRPSWSAIKSQANKQSRAYKAQMKKISDLSDDEREQMRVCQGNQSSILSAATSYFAMHGKYPPAGTIDNNHPLVKEGLLGSVPTCPVSQQEYVLTTHGNGAPPSTQCPSDIWYHNFDLSL
jgi:hypothetical protein